MDERDNATDFELTTIGEAKRHAAGTERGALQLNPSRVPPALRHLIPYAETFGISDDASRDVLFESVPPETILEIRNAFGAVEDELDAWLAGPEADADEFSEEYIAFSAVRMSLDTL